MEEAAKVTEDLPARSATEAVVEAVQIRSTEGRIAEVEQAR